MENLHVGDLVLITGPSHYEKAKVISIHPKTRVATLDNQMRITQDFENAIKTSNKAEPWDEEKFEFLHANSLFKANAETLIRYKDQLPEEAIVSINKKLEKWLNKYNLKRI